MGFSVLGCRAVILGTNNPLAKGQHFIYIYISVCVCVGGGGGGGGGCFCFVLFVFVVVVAVVVVGFVLPKIVFTVFAIRFSWPNK